MTELALLPTGFGEVPSAIPTIVCVVSDGVRAVGTASKDSAVSSTIAPTPTFGAPLAKQSAADDGCLPSEGIFIRLGISGLHC